MKIAQTVKGGPSFLRFGNKFVINAHAIATARKTADGRVIVTLTTSTARQGVAESDRCVFKGEDAQDLCTYLGL